MAKIKYTVMCSPSAPTMVESSINLICLYDFNHTYIFNDLVLMPSEGMKSRLAQLESYAALQVLQQIVQHVV